MVQLTDRTERTHEARGESRWSWIMAVAAVFVVAVVGVAWWSTRSDGPDDVEVALETVDRFLEAHNAGHVDALHTLLDPETTEITTALVGQDGERFEVVDDSDEALVGMLFWVGAGTTFRDASCDAERLDGGIVHVSCTAQSNDLLRASVGASWVENQLSFTIAGDSIEAFELVAVNPSDGAAAGYMEWLHDRYPDDLLIAARVPVTEEDALAAGQARARHVDDYAAYLEENGCPSSGC